MIVRIRFASWWWSSHTYMLFFFAATGFVMAPPDVQEFLIERCGKWFQQEKLAQLLWLPDINATFLFEIYAQTLKLPREKQKPQERFYNVIYKILFVRLAPRSRRS